MPFPAAVVMQLMAYYKAVQSGCDVDNRATRKIRNSGMRLRQAGAFAPA